MDHQEFLRAELARRIRRIHRSAAGGDGDAGDANGHADGDEQDVADWARLAAQSESGPVAVAVVRAFDPATVTASAAGFALGMPADRARAWRQAFTRTIFLTGNPRNLGRRFPFDYVSDDSLLGWIGPREVGDLLALRRLLTLVPAAQLPDMPAELTVPIPGLAPVGRRRRPTYALYMATADMTIAAYLVHLNHVIAEAVFDGLIEPASRVVLRHVPRLTRMPLALIRVHADSVDPTRLRAYAGLTGPLPASEQ